MTTLSKQGILEKLGTLQNLVERSRAICEEQNRHDEAWMLADLALRLKNAALELHRQAYHDLGGEERQLAARLDFANERISACISEFERGVDCAKNAVKIIGYVDDIVRAIARLIS